MGMLPGRGPRGRTGIVVLVQQDRQCFQGLLQLPLFHRVLVLHHAVEQPGADADDVFDSHRWPWVLKRGIPAGTHGFEKRQASMAQFCF